ncbi:MAG: XdhC family protein [Planctomycetota bacterium]|nr:XdhC family protein [Planctomycetota bacterium]
MREILSELIEAVGHGRPVAYTALVETRGSTPQKAGAVMLVFEDGSQAGTLGGGCVEAEVKRRALRLLDDGGTELLTFNLDNNYGWDDGLICGGRMTMLVDPVREPGDLAFYETFAQTLGEGDGCTEAVVLDEEKSGGGRPADRFLMDESGSLLASRADRVVPPTLATSLQSLSSRRRPYVASGTSYMPQQKKCRLLIVGAGHVGQEVAKLAESVDFDVWVVDDRAEYCSPERFPKARRLMVAPIDSALSGLEVDSNTFCVIVTRGHNHDEEALYHLVETPAAYVGMIGSRRKIKLIFEDLLGEGISRESLERVRAPLGFEIGSQSVPEIAVSIVAELVAARNLEGFSEQYRRPSLVEELRTSAGHKQ